MRFFACLLLPLRQESSFFPLIFFFFLFSDKDFFSFISKAIFQAKICLKDGFFNYAKTASPSKQVLPEGSLPLT